MIDPVEFGKAMGAIVKEATAPLLLKIEYLERELESVKTPGFRGSLELVDYDALVKTVSGMVPAPQDGKSVTVDDIRPMVEELVSKAVAALPPAGKGEDGADADMDALKSHIGELVKGVQPAAPLPVPSVEEIAGTFERRFSDLTLSWERQARDTFEKAADRMPKPKDGRDALSLDDFELTLGEDGRTVTFKMQAGETVIEKSVKIAAVIDQGTFKHEGSYEKGDGVSYGGSFWIAKCDAPKGVPGSGETDWRCGVKKGRDGKDLRENASTFDPAKGVKL